MGRRASATETVQLALELLKRIPRGRKVTAGELHEQLAAAGVTRDLRTIQRQLKLLVNHFDLELDNRSKPHGYRWKPRAQGISVPALSAQESLLLRLAELHLKHFLPPAVLTSMAPFFAQARGTLGNARQEREWLRKVRVVATSQPLLPPKIDPNILANVTTALFENRWLDVDYANAQGRRRRADVMPLGLAQQGQRLYLVGRFQGFDDDRILALHRLKSARATTLPFERPLDFDLERYDAEGRFGFGDGRRVRLSFSIAKTAGRHLAETPLSIDQRMVDRGDFFRVTATVVRTAILDWWLRGFGEDVWDVRRTNVRAASEG